MRIERVDDKTVKCFLSNEELEEYRIDYKDFVLRSDRAREVVREIIEQAEEEVGYKPPELAFDLQIMMLPDQGLILTFSEKDPMDLKNGEQILECLKEMKEVLQNAKGKLNTLHGDKNLPGEQKEAMPQGEALTDKEAAEEEIPTWGLFIFADISSLMEYASVLPKNLRVGTTLYKLGDSYCLYLDKGGASLQRYSMACVQAMEFAGVLPAGDEKLLYLQEHAECLIADNVLKKLRLN